MTNTSPTAITELDTLLRDAAHGDTAAIRCLLERHRDRLRRIIAARLDRERSPRLDPSDIVHETLADAARRLPEFFGNRTVPLFAWLYRLAADRLRRMERQHGASTVRGVGREERFSGPVHDESTAKRLIDRLAANDMAPGSRVARDERHESLAGAIARIDAADREVLVLRYLDHLGFDEIAAVLDIGLSAAKLRHLRALDRLRVSLEELGVEPSTSP